MEMKVENALTCPGTGVDHGSIGFQTEISCQLCRHTEKAPENRLVFFPGLFQGRTKKRRVKAPRAGSMRRCPS